MRKDRCKGVTGNLALMGYVVLGGLLLLSCGQGERATKIGVVLPLTGELAQPGNQALNGIRLAVQRHNAQHPSSHIDLVIEDSQAQPAKGVSAINKLIYVDHASLVLGDLTSGVTLAMAPIAEENRVVLLAPGASSPKLTNAGDYIFRNWASDNFDGYVMGRYVFRTLGKRRPVVIAVNNEYGQGLASAFSESFCSVGGALPLLEEYDQGASDFRTILAKVQTAKVDCFYLPGHPRENGYLVRQIREMGYGQTIASNLSVESPDFFAIAGPSAAGVIFTTPAFDPESNDPEVRTFVQDYRSTFDIAPDAVAGHGYDAARIMMLALANAGYDSKKVKDMLYKIRDFPGVTGRTSFDRNGDVSKSVMVKRLDPAGNSIVITSYAPDDSTS